MFPDQVDTAWRQLFGWLRRSDSDRRDVKAPVDAVIYRDSDAAGLASANGRADYDVDVPLAVTLPDGTTAQLTILAMHQLGALAAVKAAVLDAVAVRSPAALARLLTDMTASLRRSDPMLWRLVRGRIIAVRSTGFSPLNDIAMLRSLEDSFRAHRLAPVRGLRDASQLRLEFAQSVIHGGSADRPGDGGRRPPPYRLGLVWRNSDVGAASWTLAPAIVRANGVATRIAHRRMIRRRHTLRDVDQFVADIRADLPTLLAEADASRLLWTKAARIPLPVGTLNTYCSRFSEVLGIGRARQLLGDWDALSAPERTAAAFYRLVAVATRGDAPLAITTSDPVLEALLTILQTLTADSGSWPPLLKRGLLAGTTPPELPV